MLTAQAIIVVDDDASMGQAIERLLSASGWKSLAFLSAEALLESGVAKTANGFIFDIHLPGLSGFGLHEQLLEGGIRTPVIYITAHDRPWAQMESKRMGAVGYFRKPFAGMLLIETLQRHCAAA